MNKKLLSSLIVSLSVGPIFAGDRLSDRMESLAIGAATPAVLDWDRFIQNPLSFQEQSSEKRWAQLSAQYKLSPNDAEIFTKLLQRLRNQVSKLSLQDEQIASQQKMRQLLSSTFRAARSALEEKQLSTPPGGMAVQSSLHGRLHSLIQRCESSMDKLTKAEDKEKTRDDSKSLAKQSFEVQGKNGIKYTEHMNGKFIVGMWLKRNELLRSLTTLSRKDKATLGVAWINQTYQELKTQIGSSKPNTLHMHRRKILEKALNSSDPFNYLLQGKIDKTGKKQPGYQQEITRYIKRVELNRSLNMVAVRRAAGLITTLMKKITKENGQEFSNIIAAIDDIFVGINSIDNNQHEKALQHILRLKGKQLWTIVLKEEQLELLHGLNISLPS